MVFSLLLSTISSSTSISCTDLTQTADKILHTVINGSVIQVTSKKGHWNKNLLIIHNCKCKWEQKPPKLNTGFSCCACVGLSHCCGSTMVHSGYFYKFGNLCTHLLNTNRFSSTKYYVFKMERSQNRNHDYISINYPALPSHRQQNLLLCQVDERVTRSDHGHAWPLAPPLSVRGIVFTVDTQTKNY